MAPGLCWCGAVVWPLPEQYRQWATSCGIFWNQQDEGGHLQADYITYKAEAKQTCTATASPPAVPGGGWCASPAAVDVEAVKGHLNVVPDTVTYGFDMQLEVEDKPFGGKLSWLDVMDEGPLLPMAFPYDRDLDEEKDRKSTGQVGLRGSLVSEKQMDGKWDLLDTMDDGPKGMLDLVGEPVRRDYAKQSCSGRRVGELDRGHLVVKKTDEAKDGCTSVLKPGKVGSSSEVGKDGSRGDRIAADIRQQIEDAQRLAKERERKLAKERERIRQDNLLATTTRKILTTLERKLKPGEEDEFEEFKRSLAHILPVEQGSAGTGLGTKDKFRRTAEPGRFFLTHIRQMIVWRLERVFEERLWIIITQGGVSLRMICRILRMAGRRKNRI